MTGFVGIGDVLSQIVDGDAHARTVHSLGDADGVSDFGAGHEAPRYPASDCGLFGKTAQRSVFRKADEERPQHAVPARSEMVRKGVAAYRYEDHRNLYHKPGTPKV